MEVDSDKASYKQKLEVLQQQEELIEDEEEQEQKEEDARKARKHLEEAEARTAQALLPDSEVRLPQILTYTGVLNFYQLRPDIMEADHEDKRMTGEQLSELTEALTVLSAKCSIQKERDELRALMEENLQAEEVSRAPSLPVSIYIHILTINF